MVNGRLSSEAIRKLQARFGIGYEVKKSTRNLASAAEFGVKAGTNEARAVVLAARPEGVTLAELAREIGQYGSPVFDRLEAEGHSVHTEGVGREKRIWLFHKSENVDKNPPNLFELPGKNAELDGQELAGHGSEFFEPDQAQWMGTSTSHDVELSEPINRTKQNTAGALDDSRLDGASNTSSLSTSALKAGLLLEHIPDIFDTSVRLTNCLKKPNGTLSIKTVGDFTEDPERGLNALRRLPNLGRKSVLEFERLVSKWLKIVDERKDIEAVAKTLNINVNFLFDACQAGSGALQKQRPETARTGSISSPATQNPIVSVMQDKLANVDLVDFLQILNLSTRLNRFLKRIEEQERPKQLQTLGNFIADYERSRSVLLGQKNLGRQSIKQLFEQVEAFLDHALEAAGCSEQEVAHAKKVLFDESYVENNIDSQLSISDKIAKFDFLEYIKSGPSTERLLGILSLEPNDPNDRDSVLEVVLHDLLTDREFETICRRFELFGQEKETLEEIAGRYGLTRERVRQIEAKAVRKIDYAGYHKSLIVSLLTKSMSSHLHDLLGDEEYFVIPRFYRWFRALPPEVQFMMIVAYGEPGGWLKQYFEPTDGENSFVWKIPGADVDARVIERLSASDIYETSFRSRVIKVLETAKWPISIQELSAELPDYQAENMRHLLVKNFNAQFEDDAIVAIENLPARTRVIVILRDAGRALHISEVTARHKKMFGFEISEGQARNTLGGLAEALIVERGVYDIYENLNLRDTDLNQIRDTAFSYVLEKDEFISVKQIYEECFQVNLDRYPILLSDYMVYGILQDDERFDCRRGLMVGLKTSRFSGEFTHLQDEVISIISEFGPISTREVNNKLSTTRKTTETNIRNTAMNAEKVVLNNDRNYDLAERVIGDRSAIERLLLACKVNLAPGASSLFALSSKLEVVGINLNSHTLFSFLLGFDEFSYQNEIFELTDRTEDIDRYFELIGEGRSLEQDDAAAKALLIEHGAGDLVPLLEVDSRFHGAQIKSERGTPSEGGDFLDNLIDEFKY